jgi:hypothetical protein
MRLLRILLPFALLVFAGRSPAGEDAWGDPADGVSCRLTVPDAEVPMGARPEFTLHLRFDGPEGFVRNRHLEAGRVRLAFRDVESGEVRYRTPDDGSCGMTEPVLPEDFEPFAPGTVGSLALPLRLLTKEGVQLPPGRYEVTASYEGRADTDTWDVEVPGNLWAGRIVSPPVRVTVVPAEPSEDSIRVPSRIVFGNDEEGLSYGFDREDAATVRVLRRPGYFLTLSAEYELSIGGRPFEDAGIGFGAILRGRAFLDPDRAKEVRAGASLAVRVRIEVIESSWPQGWHLAFPTQGDHEVLWKGEVAGVIPDSLR